MYRTQINQDDGFVLRGLSINYVDPKSGGFADNLRIDAAGFGGNPAGSFRLWMGKGTTYRLHVFYHSSRTSARCRRSPTPSSKTGSSPASTSGTVSATFSTSSSSCCRTAP